MINQIVVSGNIGRDAETKFLPNGTAIAEFSIPVKSGYGKNEKTTWFKVVIFGKRAEGQLPSMLTKGQKITVVGEFSIDEWEKDGVKRFQCKIIASDIDLAGKAANGENRKPQEVNQPSNEVEFEDLGDLPF